MKFGKWKVEKTLKHGRTYLVTHPDRSSRYVLKVAIPHERPRSIQTIKNEIEGLNRCKDHPNVITMVDYDRDTGIPWHVTNYYSNGNIHEANLIEFPEEHLQGEAIDKKLDQLAKGLGYLNSQGIGIGHDAEIFINENWDFIIGDLEFCSIWPRHHVDSTDEIRLFAKTSRLIRKRAKHARIRLVKQQDRERAARRAHQQAQPTAPRRLVAK